MAAVRSPVIPGGKYRVDSVFVIIPNCTAITGPTRPVNTRLHGRVHGRKYHLSLM